MDQKAEACTLCGELTGKAGRGDDSLYGEWTIKPPLLHYVKGEVVGPLCPSCFDCLTIVGAVIGV